jgi:hypothetical protein
MRLPNVEAAVISRDKLQHYLLSPSHPIGRYKAAFLRRLGFEQGDWRVLERELRSLLLMQAVPADVTEHGKKYVTKGTITGPNGAAAPVAAVWIILTGEDKPRFVTAYPEE